MGNRSPFNSEKEKGQEKRKEGNGNILPLVIFLPVRSIPAQLKYTWEGAEILERKEKEKKRKRETEKKQGQKKNQNSISIYLDVALSSTEICCVRSVLLKLESTSSINTRS